MSTTKLGWFVTQQWETATLTIASLLGFLPFLVSYQHLLGTQPSKPLSYSFVSQDLLQGNLT